MYVILLNGGEQMNPIELIRENLDNFTKKEKNIAIYILKNPIEAIQYNPEVLSNKAGTSKSAFVRMCQKIGYNGYSEFRFALSNYLVSSKEPSTQTENNSGHSIINTYIDYIKLMEQSFTKQDINNISNLILNSNRIKIFGVNRTGLSAKQLRMRLAKIGQDSEAVDDLALMEDVVNSLNEDDLVIIFSITGDKYSNLVDELNENETKSILITMNPQTSINNKVFLKVVLPLVSRGTPRFLDDQALFFIFIEILLASIAENSS